MPDCEFCKEFGTAAPSRFRDLYRGVVGSRVIDRTENFVVVPTLGQIFEGSLLVIPLAHVETCALLGRAAREEMLGLVRRTMARASAFGEPIAFEHGAHARTSGGCGIYHAHLHVVPLPRHEAPTSLFPEHEARVGGLAEAWEALAAAEQYLVLANETEALCRVVRGDAGRFPSQFFRRRIVERFDLPNAWDWRSYDYVEPALIRTLADYGRHAQ